MVRMAGTGSGCISDPHSPGLLANTMTYNDLLFLNVVVVKFSPLFFDYTVQAYTNSTHTYPFQYITHYNLVARTTS